MNKFYFKSIANNDVNHQIVNRNLRFLKNTISFLMVANLLFISNNQVWGQVDTYNYTTTSGTYTAVTGTSIIGDVDDGNSSATNIGFTFKFNGTDFTQFVANSNGHIRLGSTAATSSYNPILTTGNTNAIAAVARDGRSSGGVIQTVTGSSPNRVCVIQYTGYRLQYNATNAIVSFQIRLYETTNVVEIIYTGASGNATTRSSEIGLRGSSGATDFRNCSGSIANWDGLAAGTGSGNTVSYGATQSAVRSMPSNGRILRWTPPTPTCPTLSSPANAATGISQLPTLSWTAGANTNSYDVYLSTNQTDVNNQAVGALVSTSQAGVTYSPASLAASTNYYWRVVPKNNYGNAASGCTTRSFTTAAPSPTVTVGSLSAFGNWCVGTTSTANSFNVSGINLTADVNIAALSGYTYSLSSGGSYTSTLTIPASGTLASTPVFVKFTPSSAVAFNGDIAVSSTGATTQNVAVSGTGVNTSIATQPSTATSSFCPSAVATALTVVPTVTNGSAFSYQWYSNSSASTSGGTTVGTNSASYTPLTTSNGTLYYYCVVSGCGSSATSNVSGAIITAPCINIQATGSTTISGTTNFYDDGGSTSNYTTTSATLTYTIYPSSCNNLSVTFNSFAVETCCDNLKIYNGNSISAPLLGTYTASPGTITSSATDGSLTFSFTADGSVYAAGWSAILSNVPVSAGPAQPSSIVGTLDPEVGASETYSVTNVTGVTYTWSFPSGWVINSGQGTNSVSVTVGATNGTISVTPSKCSFNGTARTASTTIPNYRWKYVSSSLGSISWTGGEARNLDITIKNTGIATWNSTYTNNIGVRWNSTASTLAGTPWDDFHSRVTVGSLAPGASGTFTLPIEAKNATAGPAYGSNLTDGTYYLAFDVVSEGQCWFNSNTGTCGPGNVVFYSAAQTVASVPTLTVGSITAFGSVCANSVGGPNSFTINGVNLTNDVVVNAFSGYTYSTTSSGTYTSTLTLTPSSGLISQTVYVKFTPTANATYNGNISVSSTGATSQDVAVTGTGILPADPTVSASPSTICAGQTSNLNGTSAGNIIQWWDAASAGNFLGSTASGVNLLVSPTPPTTYYAEAVSGSINVATQTFNYSGSIVNWTVPAGVTSINVDARGAQGGSQSDQNYGGRGARIVSNTISVTPGQVLKILVGQAGTNGNSDDGCGGGGGTFLTTNTDTPLVIAGGGGGDGADQNGIDASLTVTSTANGDASRAGSAGPDGGLANDGSGGGGLTGNGANGASTTSGGNSFTNGGTGGVGLRNGGFGGGGAGGTSTEGAGGGGGYAGGPGGASGTDAGGGGSSYSIVSPTTAAATQTGNGQIIITYNLPAVTGCYSNRVPVVVASTSLNAPTFTNNTPQCGPGIPTVTFAGNNGQPSANLNWFDAPTGGNNVNATAFTGSVTTTHYTNNFSSSLTSGSVTATVAGTPAAAIVSGAMQITANATSQVGGFTVPATGVDVDAHQFSFKLTTTAGGADGFSFNFGNDIGSSSASAEQGSGSKLSVCFDIYDATGPNSQGIRVKYAGVELVYSSNVTWVGGTNVPVVIDITNSGLITVTVNSVVLISSTQLPAAYLSADKSTWTFGYFARSGGIAGVHTIDDVDIKYASLVSATNLTSPISSTSTYYVSETVSGCTTSRTAVTVDYSAAIPSTPGAITGTATQCPALSSQTYSVAAVSGANSYTWTVPTGWSITAGATTNSITVTTGTSGQNGNITVTATNFCGTTTAATLPVTVSVIPSCIAIFAPADGATNQSAVGITLSWTAVSGATGYDVYVDDILVATNQVTTSYTLASVSVSTTYTWKVVPRNCAGLATGCSTYSFTTASSTCTPPSFSLTPTNILCFGETTGSISVSANGGENPYLYSIDNGLNYQSSEIFSSLGQGTYNIIVKGNDDCVSLPTEVILTQPASAVSSTASGSTSGCDNTVVSLTGSGSGGTGALSYLWTPSTGLSSTTVASPSLTITGTVAYSLKVTDANGCFANSSSVNITSNSPAAPSVSASPSTICSGQPTNINAVSIGNYINWWDAAVNGNQIASGLLSGANYSVTPSVSSTYFAESFTATVGSLTTQTFNYSGTIVNWTVPAGVTSINVDARGAQGGSQPEQNYGGRGARIVSNTISVTPGQVLKILVGQAGTNGSADDGCGGGGGTFLTTNTDTPLVIAGGGGGDGADQNGIDASLTVTSTANGDASRAGSAGPAGGLANDGSGGGGLTGNGANGSTTTSGGTSFTNGGAGGVGLRNGGFGGGGAGGTSTEGAGGGGGYAGGPGGASATDAGGGGSSYSIVSPTTATATQTGNGQIVITYTPVIIGCTSTSRTQVTLNINALPTISSQPSSGTQSVCQNAATTNLSVSATAGSGTISTYQWYSNTTASTTGGTLVATNTTTDLTNTYLPSSSVAGTLYYYVVVTNSNGCSVTSTVSGAITINPTPSNITATASSNTVCSGNAINLTSSATNTSTVTQTLLSPSGDGGFETGTTFAANNWTMAAITQNLWYVGSAVVNSGSRAAYISTNASAGAAATYNIAASRVSHIYRDVTFPAGATNISLTFNWQGVGESSLDYTAVYLVPTSTTPVAATALSSGQLGGILNGQSTWQSATISLSNAVAGTTQRLVFSWINDNSVGTAPGGVIDNVSITATVPETPTYAWSSNPAGFTSSQQNPTNVIPTQNTVYTVTVSNGLNCSATASTTSVTSLPLFTAGAIATTGESLCVGVDQANITSITASSGGDNSITYEWRANGTPIGSTNTTTYDPGLATTTTTYTRWAKDATCNTTFTQSTGSWVVTVGTPSSVSTLANGDFLWTGTTGSDWATTANWRQWNGSAYIVPSGFPNSATANVFLPSVTGCVANAANLNASTVSVNNMTIESGSTFTLNNASAVLNIAGGITNNGTWSTPTIGSTVNYNGSGAQTIAALTYNNLQTSTSGTKTLASGTTTANGVVTIGSSTTLDLGSNSLNLAYVGTPMVISGTFTPSTGTVNYVGNGNQNVVSTTYHHLGVNLVSGTATAAGSVTANGNLTLTAGDFDLAVNDLNIGGNLTNNSNLVNAPNVLMNGSGSQIISGSTPTTFEVLQLVGGTGTTTVNQDIIVNQVLFVEIGNTLNGGTSEISLLMPVDPFILEGSFVSGTGTVNYAAADVTNILPLTYYNLKSLGAATKSLTGNTTVSNQLNLDETLLDAATFTLSIGSSPVTANNGSLKVDAGTLELTNTTDMTIPSGMIDANTFNHLTLLGAGGATLNNDMTLNGDLILTAGSLNLGSTMLTIETNATMSRTSGLINTGTGGLIFKAANLDASALTSGNIYKLEINRAGDIVELNNGNLNVTNTFTLIDGTLDINANELRLSAGITHNGGAIDADAGTVDFNNAGAYTISNGLFAGNVHGLKVSGAGGVTLSDPIKVTNALTMAGGNINTGSASLLEIGTNTSTVGSIIWNGGTIVGPLRRWFAASTNSSQASGIFPVGSAQFNRYAQVNFTTAPDGGYLDIEYKDGVAPDSYDNLPLAFNENNTNKYIQNADQDGYWEMTPYSSTGTPYGGLDTYNYDLYLRINNPTSVQNGGILNNPPGVRLIRAKGYANGTHGDWEMAGTYQTAIQLEEFADYVIKSVNVQGFSWFNGGGDNANPLPIELLSFAGNCQGNEVMLNWSTASEFNNNYFVIEKSRDGVNWNTIHTEQGAGTSFQKLNYVFVEQNHTEMESYYRLSQVDIDGQQEQFAPIFVGCSNESLLFKTYPNPSDASFQVLVNNPSLVGKATIQLVDTKGTVVSMKEVEITEGTNLFYLNEEVTTGIYYLSISNGTNSTEVIKHSVR